VTGRRGGLGELTQGAKGRSKGARGGGREDGGGDRVPQGVGGWGRHWAPAVAAAARRRGIRALRRGAQSVRGGLYGLCWAE